jgi:probable F420-dependent oxidoreductase
MSIRIGVGPGLGAPMALDDYWLWVALCERLGLDSLWHSDQLLRPSLEPMVMLAALAARTATLRFGMNAVVIAHRDPLVVAKEIATIDYLAPGRLLPVFGVGDASDPTWAATGRSSKGRGGRANEAIALIRRLLCEDSVDFEGEHFQYHAASIAPRPQRPIPLWIGGESEAAIQRTAALGDGWLGGLTSPERAGQVVARIRAALTSVGRRIEDDHYGVVVPYRIGDPDDPAVLRFRRAVSQRRGEAGDAPSPAIAAGDRARVTEMFRRYVDAGVSKFVAIPIAADPHDLRSQTERLATEICPDIEDR